MMNATLRGKPDAGNPHVRFDEGEVASAKPRRGSLLYKKFIVLLAAATAVPVVFGFDWPESGDAVIPAEAGEVVVTDANYAAVNALTSITISDGATLVFNTSEPPTTKLKGAGAFRKRGTAKWSVSTAQTDFTGPYYVEDGIFEACVKECFGKDSSSYHIWILDGASYTYPASFSMTYTRWMHLAGNGYEGKGAFFTQGSSGAYGLARVKLEADTTINCLKGYFFWGPGMKNIDMNGKTLTYLGIDSNSPLYCFGGSTINGGKIVIGTPTQGVYFCVRGCTLDDPELEIVINHGSTIQFFNESPPIQAKLTIPENATAWMRHDHQFGPSHPNYVPCPFDPAKTCWAGPVFLSAGSTLKIANGKQTVDGVSVAFGQLGITGKISGPGDILWNSAGDAPPVFYLLNTANDFTGTITVRGGRIELGAKSTIPDWSNLILEGGDLILPTNEVLAATAFVDLFAKPTVSGGQIVVDSAEQEVPTSFAGSTIDEVFAGGGTAKLPGALVITNSTEGGAVKTRLSVTGPLATPVAFKSGVPSETTLQDAGFTGLISFPGGYSSGSKNGVSKLTALNTGKLPFQAPLRVSPNYSLAELVLTNAVIAFTNGYSGTAYAHQDLTNDMIAVGMFTESYGYHGRLTVGKDAVVTGRVAAALQSSSDSRYCVFGAVIQEPGSQVCALGQNSDCNMISCVGYNGGSGYWLVQTNASLVITGAFSINQSGSYGSSVFEIRGGTVKQQSSEAKPKDSPFFNLGSSGGCKTCLHVGSGSDTYFMTPLIGRSSGAFAVVDIAGKFALNSSMATHYSTCRSEVNFLEGGEACFTHSSRYTVKELLAKGIHPETYYNFNGGKLSSDGHAFGVLTDRTDPENTTAPGVMRVTVYEKGAILAAKAKNKTLQVAVPIEKARGNGVVSVAWTPKGGYPVAPFVEIVGDGTNATAFAEYDERTRTVTAITVTCPGENYTWARARLVDSDTITAVNYQDTVKMMEVDCAVGANKAGGVTIAAPGFVWYNVTNTYEGATVIETDAKLELQADDVIPAVSDVVLKGGTLNFNNKSNTIASLGGTGALQNVPASMKAAPLTVQRLVAGTSSALNFCGLSFNVTGDWSVSAADLAAGQTTEYATDVTFADGATIAITDLAALPAEGARYTILKVTGDHALTGMPTLTTELPEDWCYRKQGNRLTLVKRLGCVLFVR